jgi:hypothetical protein
VPNADPMVYAGTETGGTKGMHGRSFQPNTHLLYPRLFLPYPRLISDSAILVPAPAVARVRRRSRLVRNGPSVAALPFIGVAGGQTTPRRGT